MPHCTARAEGRAASLAASVLAVDITWGAACVCVHGPLLQHMQPRRHLGGGVRSWRTGVKWTAHTGGGSNLIHSIALCGPRYHPVKAAPTMMRHPLLWRRQPPSRDNEWVLRPGRAALKRVADWIRVGPAPLYCAAAILQCPAPPRDAPGLQWLAGCGPAIQTSLARHGASLFHNQCNHMQRVAQLILGAA